MNIITNLVCMLIALSMQTSQVPIRTIPLEDFSTNRPANVPTSLAGEEYRIGRDDLIEWTVFEVPELSSTARVSASGFITLPLAGAISAMGMTPQELEKAIQDAFRKNYINDPRVTVLIREYASQPVSVIGAVKLPGIYQIKGQKSLLDILAMAQGLDINAGQTIQVIRRQSQPGADFPSKEENAQAISVNVQDLLELGKTELNIPIYAGDVINVLQAGSVFVVGEVVRPGEFVLRNGKGVTVSQAVALGGGFTKEAQRKDSVIIRYHLDQTKEEIPVNAAKIFDGSETDLRLLPNDILFVPSNRIKTGINRALDSAIAVVSGRLIYGFR